MKNLVVLIGAGIGLFAASVVGLLGVQGRLSWDGTRGIPLLHALFEPPPGSGAPDAATVPDAPRTDPGSDGQPRYRVGPGLGGLDPTGPRQVVAPTDEGTDQSGDGAPAGAEPQAADGEFDDESGARPGQGQYSRGKLFDFPRIKARMSVEDVNRILDQAKSEKEEAERERAVLAQRRTELDARESDLRDREERLLEQIRGIEQSRTQLNERIEAFRAQVIMVEKQEAVDLSADAATLAAFEPQRASALLLEWWKRSDADQAKVVKILTVMDADAANAILETMEVSQAREILDRRSRVIRIDQDGRK